MAKFYASDFKITVNGTVLSNYINNVELTTEANELETTAFGDTWAQKIAGIKSGSVSLSFMQDYSAGSTPHATLNGLLGTVATVVLVPTSGTVSSTNPSWTIPALVTSLTPIAGQHGDVATFDVQWPTSGTVTMGTS